jgi:predicted membrane chloride channel (bestrophin family)
MGVACQNWFFLYFLLAAGPQLCVYSQDTSVIVSLVSDIPIFLLVDQRSRICSTVGISSTLLTVLGFVVALSLSFRSSTAYERYMEGRKYWTTLTTVSQNLARNIWINCEEREDHDKDDLIAKMFVFELFPLLRDI